MQAKRIIILALALWATACTNKPPGLSYGSLGERTIAPGVSVVLPEDHPFDGPIFATQLVRAEFLGQQRTLQSLITADERRFSVTMSVPSGPDLLRADWTHLALIVKTQSLTPRGLSSEQMLADLMLVYAPFDKLRSAIRGAALVTAGKGERLLIKNGKVIVRIVRPSSDFWNGRARLENYAYQYSLDINSRHVKP